MRIKEDGTEFPKAKPQGMISTGLKLAFCILQFQFPGPCSAPRRLCG